LSCEAAVDRRFRGGIDGYVSEMRATLMYGAGDVRVEAVPDAHLIEATDALVRVRRAAICGSDLWPYKSMEWTEAGRRMGHEFIGVVEDVGTDHALEHPGVRRVGEDHLVPGSVGTNMALRTAEPSPSVMTTSLKGS
jgi:threonine dehydrogenase-like Zn-dependent dehydrogenase